MSESQLSVGHAFTDSAQTSEPTDQSLTVVFTVSDAGEIEYVSPHVTDLGDRPRAAFGGAHLSRFIRLLSQGPLCVEELCGQSVPSAYEIEFQTAEGSWEPATLSLVQSTNHTATVEIELERCISDEQLVSLLAHDLRNPLSSALAYAELLQFEEATATRIDSVVESLHRMEEIIQDVRDLSKTGVVEPADSISLERTARKAWSHIDCEGTNLAAEGDISLRADESQLQRALENLLRNAVDHGGSDVDVTVGPLDSQQGFYIADDGHGIPEADRDRIFEFGFSSSLDGTGFGLPIVERIITAHGWSLAALESTTGGARFEIATKTE